MIRAGEESEVKITFDKKELSYFDEELGRFLVEDGTYDLFLGLNGCEDLIPAGSIYIADGSPELKCGPSWKMEQIMKEKSLTDALKKDCAGAGIPFEGLAEMARWFPHMTFAEVSREPGKYKEFLRACKEFKEE